MIPTVVPLTSDALGSLAYEQAMIKNRIEELRTLRGWSQQTLADKIGVSKMAISRYENGETLTLDRMQQLAEAFGCSVADVLNFAALSNLKNEVEAAEMVGSIASAMAKKGLRAYTVLESAVDGAGVTAGDIITVDESPAALDDIPTGALVLADVELKGVGATRIIRQYLKPGRLATNREGSNIMLSIRDPSLRVEIVGVVMAD